MATQDDATLGDAPDKFLSIVALTGYRVHTREANGSAWTEPIVGLGVRASGHVTPLLITQDGTVEGADDHEAQMQVDAEWHIDGPGLKPCPWMKEPQIDVLVD